MISVVIPLYNKEASVERSLRSVLSQDYDDFEIVIVDDGSTDRSAEVVRAIKDKRIVFIQQENGGPSKARNTGVKNAQGEWIVFLDADELQTGALEHFYGLTMQYHEVSFFCCEFYVANGENVIKPYNYDNRIIRNKFLWHVFGLFCPRTGAALYSKQLVLKCLFNEKIRRFEDLECLFRMYRQGDIFLSAFPVLCCNTDFSEASKPRMNISEDFVGHLDISNKGFWEKLAYYKLFFEEHVLYKEQTHKLYPHLYRRYDLYILCMLINKISSNKFLQKIFLFIIGNPIKQIK